MLSSLHNINPHFPDSGSATLMRRPNHQYPAQQPLRPLGQSRLVKYLFWRSPLLARVSGELATRSKSRWRNSLCAIGRAVGVAVWATVECEFRVSTLHQESGQLALHVASKKEKVSSTGSERLQDAGQGPNQSRWDCPVPANVAIAG